MQTLGLTSPGPDPDLTQAHNHCMHNRAELLTSKTCGCFHCWAIFTPADITTWLDEDEQTAECPKCGIDAVLGSAAGFPITKTFLQHMHDRWFSL